MVVFIYLRKSRAEAGDPKALAAHRSRLVRLAKEHGYVVPPDQIIEEIGSGDTLSARPRFRELLARIRALPAGSGGILICIDIDRLTRGTMADRAEVHTALLAAGMKILTIERFYDLAIPADEFYFSLKCDLARNELAQYRVRVAEKKNELTRQGRQTSGAGGYGYRWDKNIKNLVAIPAELETVALIYRDARDLSFTQIAEKYGLPRSLVASILKNPVYTGFPARHTESYRYRDGAGTRGARRLPPHRWVWPEKAGDYPAVVSLADWEAVQQAIAARRQSSRECRSVGAWCRDLVRFEGKDLRIQPSSFCRAGRSTPIYRTPPGQPLHSVPRDLVHQAADAAIRRALAHPSLLADVAAAAEDRLSGAPAPPPEKEGDLQREITAVRGYLDDLLAREQEEKDAEERASIGRRRAELRSRLHTLTADLQRLHRTQGRAALAGWPKVFRDQPNFTTDALRFWEKAPEASRRRLANLLLEAVVIRLTPRKAPQSWLREVVEVRYRPEIKRLMDC